jgi:proline iminopeptidase
MYAATGTVPTTVGTPHGVIGAVTPVEQRRGLYPPIEPFDKGFLQVSKLHRIYYEQSGNPRGQPAVVLHGGPGGGVVPFYRQYFDPKHYRIIMLDQRGAGQSTPAASLVDNTTWHLVADVEALREHLRVQRWLVFGGSWGSTLALAYAQTHPDRVTALVLRGIFMLRRAELQFFYQDGASHLFPDAWEGFLAPIPHEERHDLIGAYHRRLTGDDDRERLRCARAWTTWEMCTSRLAVDPVAARKGEDDKFALAFARIENHYFVNGGFFETDDQLLANADRIRDIPGVIVQGRYDVVCPMRSAWDLHRAWPFAELYVIPDAGHSCKEDGILDALVRACDRFRS